MWQLGGDLTSKKGALGEFIGGIYSFQRWCAIGPLREERGGAVLEGGMCNGGWEGGPQLAGPLKAYSRGRLGVNEVKCRGVKGFEEWSVDSVSE